jgi:hypothetical protein
MKYIKQYEKHIPKFKIGQPVKVIKDPNTFYLIDGYDYAVGEYVKNTCRLRRYSDKNKFAKEEGFYIWVKEDQLIETTEEEAQANKYNL